MTVQPGEPKRRRRSFMSIIGLVLIFFVLIDSGSALARGDLGADNRNVWLVAVATILLLVRIAVYALVPWLRIRREQADDAARHS